jgi:hypothetical protein
VKFQGNRGLNDESMKESEFLQYLGQGHGSYVMLMPLFNQNRGLKVDPFLDFVPILSQISVEWGSKMKTV